jgi:hypothetical protein
MQTSYCFWLTIGGFGYKSYMPSVLQYDKQCISCIYIAKGSDKPTELFNLSWSDVVGRFYNSGGRYPDSLSIFTKDGHRYNYYRYGLKRNKKFPESLVTLAPNDTDFTKLVTIKPGKAISDIENVLKDNNVPVYKVSLMQRLFG